MPEVRNLVTALLLCVAPAVLGVAAVTIYRVHGLRNDLRSSQDPSAPWTVA